ncbi:MAG: bifunctional uridylyltransferase/uridylyl-removing protein GlnD [Aestuariibacter sp.]
MALQSLLSQVKLINSTSNTDAFKTCIANSYNWLESEFGSSDIATLVTGRAAFVDALLKHIWTLFELNTQSRLALVAVGGYGRGHLQPYSDVDLLILSHKRLNKQQQESVTEFITLLWDIGLDIGQAVRTVKETIQLAKEDVTIATNLIESRFLVGCESTFDQLQDKINQRNFWPSKDYFLAKYEEQRQRHAKFNSTAYNLEPNIKENPGCLRDIQSIGWVAKKHFQVIKGKELVEHGYFYQAELDELIECRMHLWRMRFALHLISGRSENRLLFDYQPDVAEKMGYGSEGKASVEKMMKDFFRIVRRVSELNEMLLQHFRQDILSLKVKSEIHINDDYVLYDGLIYPNHDNVFDAPEKILPFFQLLCQHPQVTGLHSATLRLLRNARKKLQQEKRYLCEFPAIREQFVQLVRNPAFFELPWDLMHKHGIMQIYLPQWDHIVGMMQFDLFHAYTVDEHTHRLIKNLSDFNCKERSKNFPRCGRIVRNLDKPELLFLAGIFHDIAKGRNGDHSKLGKEDVISFCDSHGYSESEKNLISWLVEHHLTMSVTAQRRDIYDPEVVQDFAKIVRNQDHLEHLYALTLADIRATNNNLWNDWKSSLLKELFLLTKKAFENGLENTFDLASRCQEHKLKARELIAGEVSDRDIDAFWSELADDYFVRFKPEQIAWHTIQILERPLMKDLPLRIALSDKTAKSGTELLIYGQDRPRLFAQVASVLDSRNCSIQDAQIMVSQNGYIFDSFIILEQDGKRISSPSRLRSLEQAIVQQLRKPGVEHTNKRRLPRQLKQLDVPTKVRFFGSQPDVTLLELEALDTPGLLARLGHLFVELNLSLRMAKITTIGERAEDLFILSNDQNQCLTQSQEVELKKRLTETLDDAA